MKIQFPEIIDDMYIALKDLEARVERPIKVSFPRGFEYRYKQKSLEQALIQKLARIITGLRSALLLLNHGMLQEQAALHRILDELQQDISFLAYARMFDDFTDLHRRYLEAFYQEEFDVPESPIDSTQRRPSIPRQKIHAYVTEKEAAVNEPSRGIQLTRTLSKAYSGFVHGASPQIMNMYDGVALGFQVKGQCNTRHQEEHHYDLWNYFYRGLISFAEVACVFGAKELYQRMEDTAVEFAHRSGRSL
jgi:hypothetical protein